MTHSDKNVQTEREKEEKRKKDKLKEGLEETFPASDPVSVTQPGTTGDTSATGSGKKKR